MQVKTEDTITKRIDKVTEMPPEFYNVVLPPPPSVKIELTSKCNFRCGYCANRLRETRVDMEWDVYKSIVSELVDIGVKELGVFYVGESLLCNWLPEAISFAKRAGFSYVFLTTNGSLLSNRKAEAIMEAGLDSLKFSYNNSDMFQFRTMTGMAPSMFKTIQENIKNTYFLRNQGGYKTKIYASSIQYDGEQQKRMEKAVSEILPFVDEHYWLPLYSFGSQATEEESKLGYKPTPGNQGRIGALRHSLPCWAVFREGHICVDGKLSACCFDIADKWKMADLKEVSFMIGWNSEKFQRLREAHLKKDVSGTACEECVVIHA